MDVVESIITILGGAAASGIVLGVLARFLLQHWLTKDVEEFRSKLSSDAARNLETYRHQLSLMASEHGTRFTVPQERRADVIAKLYRQIVELYMAAGRVVIFTGMPDDPDASEHAERVRRHAGAFNKFFSKNRIYLSPELCRQLSEFLSVINDPFSKYWAQINTDGASEEWRSKNEALFSDFVQAMDGRAPSMIAAIETEFRSILGASQPAR